MARFGRLCVSFVATMAVVLCLSSAVQGLGTVYDIDVDKYVGLWYNMYTNYWADTFIEEEYTECTTAEYGKISDTNVTVRNAYNIRGGPSGTITGYAVIPSLAEPGKLLVSLAGVPVPATYWIIKLGPIINDKYEYAVVTNLNAQPIFILARDPETFDMKYDKEVKEYLLITGFTTPTTEPVRIYHGSDCEYV